MYGSKINPWNVQEQRLEEFFKNYYMYFFLILSLQFD
jgi:hypothetical protein